MELLVVDPETKMLENRLRRAAERQGLKLKKSGTRDPRALDYGLFALVDIETEQPVNPPLKRRECSWTLEQVEDYLNRPVRR
jgi:hypothetical protein